MMILSWPFSFYQTLFSIICLLFSRYTYHYLTNGATRRRFIASKGCKPIRKWRNKDPFLGIDLIWDSFRALKEHRALEQTKDRFDILGVTTAQLSVLSMTFVSTLEPENLKSVLSSDFQNYSLGDNRKKLMRPVLGDGIFTTDGKEWVLFWSFASTIFCFACFKIRSVSHRKGFISAVFVELLAEFACIEESLVDEGMLIGSVTDGSIRGRCSGQIS